MMRTIAARGGVWRRRAPRIALVAVLIVMILVFRHELAQAVARFFDLHPVVLLVFPGYFFWTYVGGLGWHRLLRAAAPEGRPPSRLRIALLRVQSQAMNLALPALGGVGGGTVRIGLTRHSGLARAAAAALLDDLAAGVAGLAFAAVGLLMVPGRFLGADHAVLAILAVVAGALLWLGSVSLAPALAARVRGERPLAQALRMLADNRRALAPAFGSSVVWHLLERIITAGEIYVIFVALGLQAGLPEAFFVQAASVVVGLILFFIPGQPVAAEGAIVAACSSLGIDPITGLAVALVRRARQILVGALGLGSLAMVRWGADPAPRGEGGLS